MIALLLSPIYIVFNIYIIRWLLAWMSCCHKAFKTKLSKIITISFYSFLASAIFIGFLLPQGNIKRVFNGIGNFFIGAMIYIILCILVCDLIRIILIKTNKYHQDSLYKTRILVIIGAINIIVISTICIYGAINARIIHTTKYEVTINKKVSNIKNLNIVMVADLHIGNNIGIKHIKRMVEAINKENADVVIMAGDIFDNDYDTIENPKELIKILKTIKSKNGVYAVYGNHDIKEKILAGFTFNYNNQKYSDPRMDKLLKNADIKLLQDESVILYNEIQIYGRPDYKKPNRNIIKRKTPKELSNTLDKTKPIIVIDHEPFELEQLSQNGIDLDLSGHTHAGQIFPENLFLGLIYQNPYGYKKINNMHSIVTSGVGVYGPNMRVGTIAEITSIKVNFL